MRDRPRTVGGRRRAWIAAGVGACAAAGSWPVASGAEFTHTFTYSGGTYVNRVFVDDSLVAGGVNGTVVVFDYGNAGGLYSNAAWRNFAAEKRLALTLMVSQDTFGDPNTGVYDTAGGLTALRNTLTAASTGLGVTSLGSTTLPYVFAGVSRGGTAGAIAYGWQAGSNRTVAAIGYHGNSFNYLPSSPPAAAAAIPVLYPMAQLDPTGAVTTRQGDIETAVRTGSVVPALGAAFGYRPTRGFYWTTTMQYAASHASTGDDTYPLQWLRRVWDLRFNAASPGTLTAISNAASASGAYTLSSANTTNAFFSNLSTGTFTQRDGNVWLPSGGGGEWTAESAAATAGVQRALDTTSGAFYTAPDTVRNRNFTGSGTLTFTGTGLVQLDPTGGTNAVAMNMTGGRVVLTRGVTLRNAGGTGAVWTGSLASMTVEAGCTLDVWNAPGGVRVASLDGAGTVTMGTSGTGTLTVGANNAGGTFTGTIAAGSGTLSVTKVGSGTQTLAGTNGYSGTTTVSGGVLVVTGSLANNGADRVRLAASSAVLTDNPQLLRRRATGSSYAGFGATAVGGLGTAASILAGVNTAGADDTVGMRFRLRTAVETGPQPVGGTAFPRGGGLGSDVLSLTGMADDLSASGRSDLYVLQMSYSEAELAATLGLTLSAFQSQESGLITDGRVALAFQGAGGAWATATAGNFGNPPATPAFVGSWSTAGSPLTAGRSGVDPAANVAWAVVNFGGSFAVMARPQPTVVPEPTTLLAALPAALLMRRRRGPSVGK